MLCIGVGSRVGLFCHESNIWAQTLLIKDSGLVRAT